MTLFLSIFQGFTWTAKISTGRDGGKIDGWPTFIISAGARDWQNIGVEILGGTGRDGIFLGKILGGTGRGGCCFFPRRDGAVGFFSRSGTGRLVFFSEAGRGGFFFFPRRDGAVVFVFEAGRDGVVVFFQRRDRVVVFFVRAGTGVFFLAPGRGG